jgi:hypothetical protein
VREHAHALVYPSQADGLFRDLPPILFHVPASRDTILTGVLRCLLIDLLLPKLPFKSHSSPRPPQTPAASS